MSRKALFTKLDAKLGEPASRPSQAAEPYVSRMRTRPILGSPDLISEAVARPVGAVGQSLEVISERARRAEEIERRLTEGQVIIEIDTALVDPSFISDRMPASTDAMESLTDKIRSHGQLNPILVRPHPESKDRYQVAFGHRRLRALTTLGRPVRAIVRKLSDEELVIAQGQENHEREDLSYLEKALFAYRLERRGFSRATIMSSMSIYKGDLSNMLSVASKIPQEVTSAIGPAPGIGRRGWIELASLVDNHSTVIKETITDPSFAGMGSDARFKVVLKATKPRGSKALAEVWSSNKGKPLAKVVQDQDRLSLAIDRRKAPEFAEFVLNRLRDLYMEFEANSS